MTVKPELVGEIMTTDFISISADMNISELTKLFSESKLEYASVLDGKYLMDLVAEHDIV